MKIITFYAVLIAILASAATGVIRYGPSQDLCASWKTTVKNTQRCIATSKCILTRTEFDEFFEAREQLEEYKELCSNDPFAPKETAI